MGVRVRVMVGVRASDGRCTCKGMCTCDEALTKKDDRGLGCTELVGSVTVSMCVGCRE